MYIKQQMDFIARDFDRITWKVRVRNGVFTRFEPTISTDTELPLLVSGLFDCQVNGYNGVDFNDLEKLNVSDIERVTQSLWAQGVTKFLPTIITNSHRNIKRLLKIFQDITDEQVKKSIAGFHIEGPFISDKDGPRGAHPIESITAPNLEWVEEWQKESNHTIKIITISPHWKNTEIFIKCCINQNIHVAIGHTHATTDQIHTAALSGCDLSTHLGNGSHASLPRHDNYVLAQLADQHLWASCIADGFHLPIDMLKILMKVKQDKIFLVSDSTAFGGMAPGNYTTYIGGDVVLTSEGKLHVRNNKKLLAGSASSLLMGINVLLKKKLVDRKTAWELGSKRPHEYLKGGNLNLLSRGMPADFLFLSTDKHNQMIVEKTFVSGIKVYERT